MDKTIYSPSHLFQGQLKKRKLESGGEASNGGGTAQAPQTKTGSGGSGGSGRRRKKARKEAAEEIAEQSKSMGGSMNVCQRLQNPSS